MAHEETAFDIMAKELSSLQDLTSDEEEIIEQQKKGKVTLKEEDEELDNTDKDEEVVKEDEEEVVEEIEEEEVVVEEKKPDTKKKEETENLGEYEEDITKYVKTKLEDKLGVTLGDYTKIGEIVDDLAQMVEDSTKDVYANEEVEELNEYVRNGGDLRKFYSDVYSDGVDLDLVDLENATDQKRIVKEDFKNRGYSDKEIDRKLTRYEDSGVLRDEAEDSVDNIKEFREAKKKELLDTAKKEAEVIRKRNERYISDVQKSIKELKEIRGIAVSEKEKRDLFQYIFIPETDGLTKYQKEYSSNAKNLIESAFLTMKGDALIQRALAKGATSTAKALKDKLSQKGNRIKKTGTQEEGVDALTLFARQLRK